MVILLKLFLLHMAIAFIKDADSKNQHCLIDVERQLKPQTNKLSSKHEFHSFLSQIGR